MGVSLTGTKIKDTYDGLLKTTDNGALGASAKQITDGLGTGSPIYVSTSSVGIGATPDASVTLHIQGAIGTTNGTAAAPTHTFYGDSNTGMYRAAADTLGFSTAGSERMRIDSSGNVTISTGDLFITGDNILDVTQGNNASYFRRNATQYIAVSSDSTFHQFAFAGNKDVYFNNTNANYVAYGTNNTERMRITSGGYLKASNTGSYLSSSANVHEINQSGENLNTIITRSTATSPYGISMRFSNSPNNTTNNFFEALDGTATRIIIWSNGNVENYNNSYGAISDAKLKENITDASPKLDDLMQVQVRNYNLIGDDKKQLGVVAQELETIFPSMIDESTDFEEKEVELRDENGEIVYETEQVLVSEEVAEVTEEVLHEAIAEELDEEGNIIVEAQEAWTETIIVTPFQEAVYETVTTDRPVMTTERVDLGTTTKSVKYSVFVPMLIKAIQELKAEVDALKGA